MSSREEREEEAALELSPRLDHGGCVLAAELGAHALWPSDSGRKAGEKGRERGQV